MPFSQGSRTGLSYITEASFGITPVGNFTPLPFTTHGLNLSKDRVEGTDIRSDRMPRHDRHGNRQIGGPIVADLRALAFDDLLESTMFSTFSADIDPVLETGTTLKSFSIEDAANDIGQYRLFTGCAVSSMAISVAPKQMVTTTFTMVGKDMTIGQAGKTVDTLSETNPFDSYSGDISISDNGTEPVSIATVTSLEMTVDNGLNPTFVIGSDSTPQLEYGRSEISGTLVAYFEDATLIERFVNETETALSFNLSDPEGTVTYKFFLPRVKINSADAPVENPQSRMITCEFVALFDETEGTNLRIIKDLP